MDDNTSMTKYPACNTDEQAVCEFWMKVVYGISNIQTIKFLKRFIEDFSKRGS